jgi:hypothetical protein
MGEVVVLQQPRKETVRGAVRASLTDAVRSVKNCRAVVIVALGDDGTFALRSVSDGRITEFDKYSRAGAICDRERMALLADE